MKKNYINWREFLEEYPPYVFYFIREPFREENGKLFFDIASVNSFCDDSSCGKSTVYRVLSSEGVSTDKLAYRNLQFECTECRTRRKTIGIRYDQRSYSSIDNNEIRVMKLFELPPFYNPISEKIRNILGSKSDLYLKGRSSELSNMGLAAFEYYRKIYNIIRTSICEDRYKSFVHKFDVLLNLRSEQSTDEELLRIANEMHMILKVIVDK